MADVSITANNVQIVSGTAKTGKAGAAITAGQAVYTDTNGTLSPAQANAAGTATVVGIALNSCASGQTFAYLDSGAVIKAGGTLVAGKWYALSAAAAGGVAPHADLTSTNIASWLGYALTTANLQIQIVNTGLVLA